jgi:Bacterial membrane protein YfhO
VIEGLVKRLRQWCPALALAAMLVALFPAVFLRGQVISANDVLYQYPPFNQYAPPGFERPHNPLLADEPQLLYSARAFLKQQVRQGVWPWWLPNILCGQSFALNLEAQIFHPMQLLVWTLPQTVGETAYALLKLLTAGLGMFFFLRRLGVVAVAALAGGLAFMAGSYNIVWLSYPQSSVATMLPWALWIVESAFQRRYRPAATLLAGGAIFYLLLAGGHPNTIIVSLFLAGLYTVYRLLASSAGEGWGTRLHAPALVGSSLVLGILLGGVFLAPFVMARLSGNFYYGNRIDAALFTPPLPLREYLSLILPLAGGSPVTGDDRHLYNFNENAMFVGVVSLVPQLLALPWLVKRREWLFLLGAAAVVVLTLQDATPVAYVVRRIPLLRDTHLLRISLVLQFALAAGGGIAWHVLAGRPADRRHRLRLGAAALLLIVVGLISTASLHSARGYGWFVVALVGGGGAAAALPWISRPARRTWLVGGVGLLLGMELLAAHGGYNGTLSPHLAELTALPLNQQLRAQLGTGWYRIAGTDFNTLTPNSSAWIGLHDIRGYDVPISQRYVHFLRYGFSEGRWPFDVMCCHGFGFIEPWRRLYQLMGVRHLLAPDPTTTYRVFDLPDALPHVFWAQNLRRSSSDIPHDVEVLRHGGMVADLPAGQAPRDGSGGLRERPISVNAVAVEADVTQPGVLVLNEMPIEGWRARVDGRRATIMTVNVIHTGVWLESGHHSIEFYFRPPGVLLGAIMSVGGLVAMGSLALAAITIRHPNPRPEAPASRYRDVP